MTSVFDGLAGVLNSVFGAPVVVTDKAGASVTLQAIFREEPVEVPVADGRGVLTQQPTLKVQRDQMAQIGVGYTVRPVAAPGRRFRVLDDMIPANVAADAFVWVALEEIKD